jgi:hypothetical protein
LQSPNSKYTDGIFDPIVVSIRLMAWVSNGLRLCVFIRHNGKLNESEEENARTELAGLVLLTRERRGVFMTRESFSEALKS